MDVSLLAAKLFLPLARLVAVMAVGLLVASLLESLHWTRFVARLASPLARFGHMRDVAGASFALAFFSSSASNALLADAYEKGKITRRELLFANLFNSSPTFLVHLPTLFSLVFAFLGSDAFIYVGLTFAAALLRTLATIAAGKFLLPQPEGGCPECILAETGPQSRNEAIAITLRRFRKRLSKLLTFTIPIYCLFFAMQQAGWFKIAEAFLAEHADVFSFLRPESLSIIALHLVAESGAALSAAASLGHSGALAPHEIILALLVGNIVSSPMRAVRHQFPSYAGFFAPGMAMVLVLMNQMCRVLSLALVAAIYHQLAF